MRSKKRKKRHNLTIFVKVIVIFFFLLTAFFVFKSIPRKEIKENKKNNIRVNVVWNNIEENSVEDSKIGLIYNNKLDIPVTVTVTQYLGEEIKEYE